MSKKARKVVYLDNVEATFIEDLSKKWDISSSEVIARMIIGTRLFIKFLGEANNGTR